MAILASFIVYHYQFDRIGKKKNLIEKQILERIKNLNGHALGISLATTTLHVHCLGLFLLSLVQAHLHCREYSGPP